MDRKYINILVASLFLFITSTCLAQNYLEIKGRVADAKGYAVSKASVSLVGGTARTITDSSGIFCLKINKSDHDVFIKIEHIAYQTKKIKLSNGQLSIDVILLPIINSLEDVVVIGYQSVSRKLATAAISSVSGDAIKDMPEASMDQMLQGRLAGVSVQSSTGEPGAKTNIVIRGMTNVDYDNGNGGNTGPLYVIDGVIYDVNNISGSYSYSNPLSFINPNDIESIDVLKDASASAIYGARAGNGVIIVKTKKAKSYRPEITVSGYFGVVTHPKFRKIYTGMAERKLKLSLLENQLPYTDIYNGDIPLSLTDSLNPAFNNDVDWQGMLLRSSALINSEDFRMEGRFGSSSSYTFSINHYQEDGALKGFSSERLAPHFTFMTNPIPRMSIYLDVMAGIEKRHHGTASANSFYYSSWSFPTSLSQLSESQKELFSGESNAYDDNPVRTINASLNLADTLAHGFVFNSNIGISDYEDQYQYFSPEAINGVWNIAYDIDNKNPSWTWENYFLYLKNFKNHHFSFVAGESQSLARTDYTYAYAAGVNISGIYTLQTVPSGTDLYVTTSTTHKSTLSYYGRINYDYMGRYMISAAFRRDASSIYSSSNRWGTFPSVSFGWILSDESFFQPLKKVTNWFKIRASYGITGVDPGSWYAKYQTLYNDASFLGATTGLLGGSTSYVYLTGTPSTYNGTTVITPFPYANSYANSGTLSSKDVRWEKYPQLDLGFDLNFFNDRITTVVDWYRKDADDKYLWQIPAEQSTGYAYYSGNYVNLCNEGLEIAINTRNLSDKSKFQWNTSFNISFNKNFITKLPNNGKNLYYGVAWFRRVLTMGEPIFSYMTWQCDGVYATDNDVPTDPISGKKMTYFGTTLKAGDAKIKDQNGDYNIDYEDQVISGNPNPKITGGFSNSFSYKNLSLSVFCTYALGNKIINGFLSDALNGSASYSSWMSVAGPASYASKLNEFWQQSGDQTKYPRLVYAYGTNSSVDPWNVGRSYFLEPGWFIKIKQITLNYNVSYDSKFMRALNIKSMSLYAMAENVAIFKQSEVADPELYDPTTGSVNTPYPSALKFTLGFRFNL